MDGKRIPGGDNGAEREPYPAITEVDRKFCKNHCAAWHGTYCGAVVSGRGAETRCLWRRDEMKRKEIEARMKG